MVTTVIITLVPLFTTTTTTTIIIIIITILPLLTCIPEMSGSNLVWNLLPGLWFIVVFLSRPRRKAGWKLRHDCFHPHAFEYISR
jgi:hypothetical protein